MNSRLLAVLIVMVLIVGSAVVKKTCKSGYYSWCAPVFTVRHHVKTQPLHNPARNAQTYRVR